MSFKKAVTNWLDTTSTRSYKPEATWLFSRLVYLWFILFWLWHWEDYPFMYGENALMPTSNPQPGGLSNLAYYLSYHPGAARWALWIHLSACVLSMWERIAYLPRIAVYVTAVMFYFGGHHGLNSGFVLMLVYSGYLVVINLHYKLPLLRAISNFGVWACMIQLCLVYAVAAAYKWTGEMWPAGTTLHYVVNSDFYRPTFVGIWLAQFPNLLTIFTWLGLAYQTLFPVFIWIKPTKRIFLLAGLGFHFFIAIVLNLYFFSAAMMLGYLLFARREVLAGFARRIPGFSK